LSYATRYFGEVRRLPMKLGRERWVAASRREQPANAGAAAVALLRIDLLTSPGTARP